MHENRLLNKLLDKYNPLERPVADEADPLNVTFGLTLQQIIDVVSNRFWIIYIGLFIFNTRYVHTHM